MTGLDVDRDAAHDAAQRELSKPMYPKGSLTDRVSGWIDDLIYRVMVEGASVPGGWLTVGVLVILVVIAAVVAVRVALRTTRTNRSVDAALFDSGDHTADEHRAAAQRAAAQGDWSAAIRHRLRAVARHLEESAVLDPVPGRTATELARDAAAEIPALTAELHTAAVTFNDVTYGDLPGTQAGYGLVADLDDRLRTRTSTAPVPAGPASDAGGWAEIR